MKRKKSLKCLGYKLRHNMYSDVVLGAFGLNNTTQVT